MAADDLGIWTSRTSIFTENRASITLHRAAGYSTGGAAVPTYSSHPTPADHDGDPKDSQDMRVRMVDEILRLAE